MDTVKAITKIEAGLKELMGNLENPLIQSVPLMKKAVKSNLNAVLQDIDADRVKALNEGGKE
jgi:hypothetical protein